MLVLEQFHGIPSVENYNYKYNLSWSSLAQNITEQKLFDDVTQRYEDIINSTRIRYFKPDEIGSSSVTFYNENSTIIYNNVEVTEQRHRLFGKCYSIRPVEKYRVLGIYYIKFTL